MTFALKNQKTKTKERERVKEKAEFQWEKAQVVAQLAGDSTLLLHFKNIQETAQQLPS